MGPVNAYLSGRTLVDPGPDSEEAWSTLVSELDDRGLKPDDIERVLITHPHPDHFGLADRLRSAGADVLTRQPVADITADYPGRITYEKKFFEPLLERHGLSAEVVSTVVSNPEGDFEYAPRSRDRPNSRGWR
ncbi:MBL fold metallo-hydrolase (plasmid) [Haloferacaceae archaeon DSL9]